ncbi:O-methyltransferase [Methylobacterium sp. E-066]|uniref:O-methyltransferase n=1 Tax=Methylobacterium sp. E-066 TaxID=2836584 RepID=UPI001FBA2501|nr:O-methyltransferase [Methylobacterium sp. E-066]MCJ2143687.1 hypothetical protein [Methylobacterium sp. E-066]
MPSFDTVNYSIRTNKAIQRSIIFDSLGVASKYLPLNEHVYIGFGSIWFTDFIIAHKQLGIQNMLSIESNPIGVSRARFNSPFRTIRVEEGHSSVVLPKILNENWYPGRPWIAWLDYDYGPDDTVRDDIDFIASRAPANSILLLTVNVGPKYLGNSPRQREDNLRRTFGTSVAHDAGRAQFDQESYIKTTSRTLTNYAQASVVAAGRPLTFVPCFDVAYRDGTPMLTVGGAIANQVVQQHLATLSQHRTWPGRAPNLIEVPPLSIKEASAMQSLLPLGAAIPRRDIQSLGFDLDDKQIAAFCDHYTRYPSFMQVIS